MSASTLFKHTCIAKSNCKHSTSDTTNHDPTKSYPVNAHANSQRTLDFQKTSKSIKINKLININKLIKINKFCASEV